jgi:hypothetical protein
MVDRLLDEYMAAFARGESPDVRAYLAQSEELSPLIEAFVVAAKPPEPGEDAVAAAAAWAEGASPLAALRAHRGLDLEELAASLVRSLGLEAGAGKVRRYVEQLEQGTLSRRGVDRRVWAAWAETLRTTVETLLAWRRRPLPAAPAGAVFRAAMAAPAPALESAAAKSQARGEPDEVDRLFLFGG